MDTSIPLAALPACILVLLYSVICLGTSILLVCMLFGNGERTNYVTLIATVVSISSLASIVQQIYYACEWRNIRETAFEQAKLSIDTPTIGFGPLLTGANLALFEIQFYCYNVNSVLILFWAIALLKGVFNLRFKTFLGWEYTISLGSKIFAVVVPALLVGISFTHAVRHNIVAFLVINNVLMLGSLLLGSICMIFILVKYIHSRHLFASIQGSSSVATSSGARSGQPTAAKIRVDKMLLLRFSVAFVILSAFEVTVILFEFSRRTNARTLAESGNTDLAVSSTVNEILLFMPGVTASLLAFLLFGTTAQFRQKYAKAFKALRCWRRRRPSLERRRGMDSWDPLDSPLPIDTGVL